MPAKRYLIIVIVLAVYVAGIAYMHFASLKQPITLDQSFELKMLACDRPPRARAQDKNAPTDFETVWNEIMQLENIKEYGSPSSFEDFKNAQYREAKSYLEKRIIKTELQIYENKKKNKEAEGS